MFTLWLLLTLTAAPAERALEWPKLVEVMRGPDAGAAHKAMQRYVAAHPDARGTMRMALVYRALDARPPPAGSFSRRVSLEDCKRMTEVLRRKPALMPDLDCRDLVGWQQKLDDGWRSAKPAERRAIASALIDAAAPKRDALDALLSVPASPKKYFAELFGLPASEGERLVTEVRAAQDLLFELVLEADALSTESAGDCEEFLVRYPDHPFAATALFTAGHQDQLRARFPRHPLTLSLRE
jgi:hypothetical protein